MWPVLATIILLLGMVHWTSKNRRILNMANKLPGPTTLPIVGNAMMFIVHRKDFIGVFTDLLIKYGEVVRIWLVSDLNVVVSNPEDVKMLLTSNKTTMRGRQYKYMANVIGEGILSGSGTPWKKHRKIAAPNYGTRAVKCYTDVFNREVDMLIQKYKETPKGHLIDIYKYIVQTTSYIVCQTLIGLSREEMLELPHLQTLIQDTPDIYEIIFDRMTKWYLQLDPVFWLTKHYRVQKKFLKLVREFSETILKYRRKKLISLDEKEKDFIKFGEHATYCNDNSTHLSVIDRFILSQELDPVELIDETFTVFTTSQEASAKISSTVLLLMALHPKCQEKLYAEILSVIGKNDKPVTCEDIKQMHYLEMVLKETIRLFPIAGMIQRTVTEDVAISTCTIPAGASLLVPMYHMHRDPKYWRNPDAFDPERFSPENIKTHNPYSYIPFSLGPMDCLGRHFASKLVKTMVVRIMLNFKLATPSKYEDIQIMISISATPMDGIHTILTPR